MGGRVLFPGCVFVFGWAGGSTGAEFYFEKHQFKAAFYKRDQIISVTQKHIFIVLMFEFNCPDTFFIFDSFEP